MKPPPRAPATLHNVFGAPPPPFGTGRMSKKEREINDWLVKNGFNPLPQSNYNVGESPNEVARRLKGSSKDETPSTTGSSAGDETPTKTPKDETTITSPVRPREAKPPEPRVRRKVKQKGRSSSSKR
jgi:hypothetical protein